MGDKPDTWTLERIGDLLWEFHADWVTWKGRVDADIADLRLRVGALEQGKKLVPTGTEDGGESHGASTR